LVSIKELYYDARPTKFILSDSSTIFRDANIKQLNSFIDTKLIHNFLYKLHKIKFFYMFRASSAHLQEVNDVNCTCMQPLVFSFSAGGRLVHWFLLNQMAALFLYNFILIFL